MAERWVFGYGSLMWCPRFAYLEVRPALLMGVHRALCVSSVVHRGSRPRPGLVLGLDLGGQCQGVAFRVAPGDARHIRGELIRREQVTQVYREATRRVCLLDGSARLVRALCFLTDRTHPQYAGNLPLQRQVWMVRRAVGRSGRNADYVIATCEHLNELGITEPRLTQLVHMLHPSGLPRTPDLTRRTVARHRTYGVLKPVSRPVR